MREIETRGRSVEIPTEISELSPEQYEYYCFLAYALGVGSIDVDYFRIRWISYLIGMGKTDFTILKPEYIAELDRQMDAIDGFFVEQADGNFHLDMMTPVNLLPSYKGFKGPGDFLEGVTYGEFVECLTVFEGLAGADEKEMTEGYNHIARTLYHIPEETEVPSLLTVHAPTLFASVWREIQGGPIEINGKKIDFRIIFKGDGSSKADDHTGWTGITFEVATAGLFGSVKDVEASEMWDVLMYLYKCKFEYLNDKNK